MGDVSGESALHGSSRFCIYDRRCSSAGSYMAAARDPQSSLRGVRAAELREGMKPSAGAKVKAASSVAAAALMLSEQPSKMKDARE